MDIERVCRASKRTFLISDLEQEVLRRFGELSPILKGEPLPLPTVHPFEGLRQLFSYGSLTYLFKRPSAVSGKNIITRYNPEMTPHVCTHEEFLDRVDNTSLGRKYDFSRGFFEQWAELLTAVTHPALNKTNCEDSEYVNGAVGLKSCYLCFSGFESRDCLYSLYIEKCNDSWDVCTARSCELCYDSNDIVRCYEVQHCEYCFDSQNLFGCSDCSNCHDCFGCTGLDRKSFCIFNEQVTKERYAEFLSRERLNEYSGRQAAIRKCRDFVKSQNHRIELVRNSSASTGAYLERCEDVIDSWNCSSCKETGYMLLGERTYRAFRGAGRNCEYAYAANTYNSQVNAYCYSVFGGTNNFYSMSLFGNCSNCFGCIALNAKQHCILNRQLSKEEYFDLAPRIVSAMKDRGEWGQLFPPKYSPHYYHEAGVHEYMKPIPEAAAKERGYRFGAEPKPAEDSEAISGGQIPSVMDQAAYEKLLSAKVKCESSGRIFNLQKKELDLHLRYGIPAPRLHWRERLCDRLRRRELIPAV